jgi:hypothetical protein
MMNSKKISKLPQLSLRRSRGGKLANTNDLRLSGFRYKAVLM